MKCTIRNILEILQNDLNLKDKVKYNEFSNTIDIVGELPWSTLSKNWTGYDDAELRLYLERKYGIYNRSKTNDALKIMLGENKAKN